jgi:hypothetical protein
MMYDNEKLRLRDPAKPPSAESLARDLGDSFAAYEAFTDALAELEIEQEWQWYTPHKAWFAKGMYFWTTARGTRKEKNLFWLHVFDGFFDVAVWFLEKNREELLMCADLSGEVRQEAVTAATFGKLATFPVTVRVSDVRQLADVYELIEWKKKLET